MVTLDRLALYDWSVLGFTRKLLCVSAMVFALGAAFNIGVPAQIRYSTAEPVVDFRLNQLERRTEKLELLPDRTARIETSLTEVDRKVEDINGKAWYLVGGMLLMLGDRVLGIFGVKLRDRT